VVHRATDHVDPGDGRCCVGHRSADGDRCPADDAFDDGVCGGSAPPAPAAAPRGEGAATSHGCEPDAAPLEAPKEIKAETGLEAGFERSAGVEGGIIGGVAGGITGGIPEPPPPPPPPAAPVRVGGNIKPPQKTRDVRPTYPPIAQSARVQGIVIIEATIGPDGAVKDAKVLRSIPLLDQAALDAVRQWVFTPTLLNGVPVPVIMTVTVQFTLQ